MAAKIIGRTKKFFITFKTGSTKEKLYNALFLVSLIVFIVSLSIIGIKQIQYLYNEDLNNKLTENFNRDHDVIPVVTEKINNTPESPKPTPESVSDAVYETIEPQETTSEPEPVIKEKYNELLEINKDIVGYIEIPGTKVKYFVLQDDDNEYYLKHDIKGNYTAYGSIFMDCESDPVHLDKNTLIHGHHMRDGSMFRDVEKYKYENYFNEHRTIYFDTLYDDYEWEVFAVYVIDGSKEGIYIKMSDEFFENYIKKIQERSVVKTDTVVEKDDIMLTLNTCSYETNDSRTIVHAKLVKKNGVPVK